VALIQAWRADRWAISPIAAPAKLHPVMHGPDLTIVQTDNRRHWGEP